MSDEATFVVTRDWLHAHSTPGGGWTAEQLAVFDIPWPPRRGWLTGLVGKSVTVRQKEQFEDAYRRRQEFRRAMGVAGRVRPKLTHQASPRFEVTVTVISK